VRSLAKIVMIAGFALSAAGPAAAQSGYPNKPIKLVVPFPAGSATDAVARILAAPMGTALGQPVIVENKGGADGAIAGQAVAKSAPDGYTLFMATNSPMAAVPVLHKNAPYNSVTDFTPISFVGRTTFYLVVNSQLPVKTLDDLLKYAKANPDKLNYASSSTTGIVSMAQLLSLGGVNMHHIPYKGEPAAMLDLVSNRVQAMFSSSTNAQMFLRDGKIRALATTNLSRSSAQPDVPTMSEAGMPQFSISPWLALFGPANLPKEIVDRLNKEVFAAFARPDVKEQMEKQTFPAQASTPQELAKFLRDQLDVWQKTTAEAGIRPE
jgi:tripartite-type tricarboxylate transporter receptor subunit TctC